MASEWLADFDSMKALRSMPRRWLVTGAAGFIGSHLVETLLDLGQDVVGLDNFATGHRANLSEATGGPAAGSGRFRFLEGDIRDPHACAAAATGVDVILHQAALGSVPRSLADPRSSHDVNVAGFLCILEAARQAQVPRLIYAASSSTYGDEPNLPKREDRIGSPLSPYAATKLENEIWAGVYARSFDYRSTGLRYFNVFGPRQDPEGPYAAVIPKWIAAMTGGATVVINGDGQTSRDFCFVANAVQANILAALAPDEVQGQVFNVAAGRRTSLDRLFDLLREQMTIQAGLRIPDAHHGPFRAGDVAHSEADISKACGLLGYKPSHDIEAGLVATVSWFLANRHEKVHDAFRH